MANKFIIFTRDHEIGYLRFGIVNLHSELKGEYDSVYGGGEFKIDNDKRTLELYGESFDFGKPIFDGWDKLKISDDFKGYKITYKHKPEFYGGEVEIIDLTNKLDYDENL